MEDSMDELSVREKSAEYLWKIGNFLSNSCPPASRFYMSTLYKSLQGFPDLLKNRTKISTAYCHYCGAEWNSDSCKIRIRHRMRHNKHIKKLLQLEKCGVWRLNNQQKQKLRRFRESTNKTVYRCFACRKTTIFAGTKSNSSRLNISANTSTPVSKLKLNKSDLNAGLFIPSPCDASSSQKKNFDTHKNSPNTSTTECDKEISMTSNDSMNLSNSKEEISKNSFKNETPPPSCKILPKSSLKQQATAKKKKTLLAEILNHEQNKKSKTKLSSFLVSL